MLTQFLREIWFVVFVILLVVGILAGQGLAIGFGAMGLIVLGISWLWNRLSLEELTYERELSQRRAFVGEEVSMTLTLTNKKPVPLARLVVSDELPEAIKIADADVGPSTNPSARTLSHSTSMSLYERIRWEYRITPLERGYHRLGPARIESGDLFGFFGSQMEAPEQTHLLVYPRVVPLPELDFPASRPLGESSGGSRIFEDPLRPVGIRDYQPGDPLNLIDWKATARAQRMQARTFEPSSKMTMILVVAVETTARYWEGYSPANLERVITVAASVASRAVERQYSLGLFSNGTPILTDRPMRIPASRAPEQLTIILEVLATIRPLAMGPMAAQLAESARRFPVGSTLVIVTALMTPELVDALGTLRGKGHPVVVLNVADDPCPVLPEGVIAHELGDHLARTEFESVHGKG